MEIWSRKYNVIKKNKKLIHFINRLCNACGLQYLNFTRKEKECKRKHSIQNLLN